MAKKPSYPKKEALQPIKIKAGLTNGEDEAQKGKMTRRGLQRKMKNDPRKDVGASEIVWDHLDPKVDNIIHLGALPPLTATVLQVLR